MANNSAGKAKFSIPSIIALVSAVLSFATGAAWGFLLALLAVLFGALGIVLSLSPQIRGGLISTFSLFAGSLGLIIALIKALGWALR